MHGAMAEVVIELDNISFQYPDGTVALRGINLQVERGGCIAVLGANGSGKTTLLHILTGIIPHLLAGQVSGRASVMGFDVVGANLRDIAQHLAIVQQDPETQILFGTVEAECAFAPSNFGLPREEIKERIEWGLELVGLAGFQKRSPGTLSYGQKQRLAIAAALAMKPEVLLLDEPFADIDPSGRKQILSALVRLKRENGLTIVVTTHDLSQVAEIVDYVLLLSVTGEALAFDHPREVIKRLDLLNKARINVAPVTRLAMRIGAQQLPLTVDECCDLLLNSWDGNLAKVIGAEISSNIRGVSPRHRNDVVIETVDLHYAYPRGQAALRDINLRISKGDFVGVVGPNGSGKTTLLKHLVGLLRPLRGKVLLNGQDLRRLTIGEISKEVGILLQNPDHQLLYENTVFDEIAYGLRQLGAEQVDRRVKKAAAVVGLEEKQDLYPGKLSSGERTKLILASIIALEPEVIILDEPFFGQDYFGRAHLAQILKSLNERGHTIIVVTHNLDVISEYADRWIVLFEGKVVADDSTGNILASVSLDNYGLECPQLVALAKCLEQHGIPVRGATSGGSFT